MHKKCHFHFLSDVGEDLCNPAQKKLVQAGRPHHLQSSSRTLRVDLRRRLLYTLGMLTVFRLAAHVPVPGLDRAALAGILGSGEATGQLFRFLNLLSGGALENFSVVAMGVYPYITASIIMQLLAVVIPRLQRLQDEGETGRKVITQWTRYVTVILALLQAQQIALNAVADARTVVTGIGDDTFSYTFEVNQEVLVASSIPFNEKVTIEPPK